MSASVGVAPNGGGEVQSFPIRDLAILRDRQLTTRLQTFTLQL